MASSEGVRQRRAGPFVHPARGFRRAELWRCSLGAAVCWRCVVHAASTLACAGAFAFAPVGAACVIRPSSTAGTLCSRHGARSAPEPRIRDAPELCSAPERRIRRAPGVRRAPGLRLPQNLCRRLHADAQSGGVHGVQ
eukprot:363794-Chlamydomonas_euryale.AAC.14